jgi:hypothetical protein
LASFPGVWWFASILIEKALNIVIVIIIISSKKAPFEPQPSLEYSARMSIQFSQQYIFLQSMRVSPASNPEREGAGPHL